MSLTIIKLILCLQNTNIYLLFFHNFDSTGGKDYIENSFIDHCVLNYWITGKLNIKDNS